ncbi:hypothetical protein EVAR_31107_1 [Eumeta japonica]|uniref:Uncharacterized protein n=1 Tax=Eumeta variegata TaxID=151549 RepID=A0A4C1VEC2_EUMVA|nr:hypothetical protein EVAR_31107_1 [Eumeta japonica]
MECARGRSLEGARLGSILDLVNPRAKARAGVRPRPAACTSIAARRRGAGKIEFGDRQSRLERRAASTAPATTAPGDHARPRATTRPIK